jgi:hypothetical protein
MTKRTRSDEQEIEPKAKKTLFSYKRTERTSIESCDFTNNFLIKFDQKIIDQVNHFPTKIQKKKKYSNIADYLNFFYKEKNKQ